jgi:two-component system, chemotaxis family, chemotaxis protein CheY
VETGSAPHGRLLAVQERDWSEGAVPKTVLVADDAAFMRMILRDILRADGYSICEAVNGRDACEKFAEIRPDVVTLDVAMPEMDGIAAARTILERDPDARVIIISAQARPEIRAEALSIGAVDFIAKPFPPERLLDAVRNCLAGAPR